MPSSLAEPVHSDITIKKSRFIGCVQAVPDRAAALAVVVRLRAETSVPGLAARLNEAGQGALEWLE